MDILIIQILRMGDALQLFPIARGIKTLFPDSRLCVLTSELGARVLEGLAEIDEVFILQKEQINAALLQKGKSGIVSALKRLGQDLAPVSSRQWDWVINFGYSFSSALLSFLMETKHRSGFYANRYRQFISKEIWFSLSMASFLNRRYSIFNWVDINKNIIGIDRLPAPASSSSTDTGRFETGTPTAKNAGGHPRIIGMCPGASDPDKRWPETKFGALGKDLTRHNGCSILIFGSEAEKELGGRIARSIGDGAENLAGKTTLDTLKRRLASCDVLVTNDTGPMHLAASIGTPVVALFFSTHFVETGPYGLGHIAVHPDMSCFPCRGPSQCSHKRCLDAISPETIQAVVDRMPLTKGDIIDVPPVDAGKIKAYRSGFDTWGYLDWQPVLRETLSLQHIEKLLFKRSWLSFFGKRDTSDHPDADDLITALNACQMPSNGSHLYTELPAWIDRLETFKRLVEEARHTVIRIQSELHMPSIDEKAIQSQAESLETLEAQIASFDRTSSIAMLGDLLSAMRDNIEQVDPLKLSTQTAEVYRRIANMTDAMIRGYHQVREWMDADA